MRVNYAGYSFILDDAFLNSFGDNCALNPKDIRGDNPVYIPVFSKTVFKVDIPTEVECNEALDKIIAHEKLLHLKPAPVA